MSPISKFCHQHKVTNIKSPTSTCQKHLCSRFVNIIGPSHQLYWKQYHQNRRATISNLHGVVSEQLLFLQNFSLSVKPSYSKAFIGFHLVNLTNQIQIDSDDQSENNIILKTSLTKRQHYWNAIYEHHIKQHNCPFSVSWYLNIE